MKACSTTKGGSVKTAELRRKLLENGAIFIRHGGNHDIWERNGIQTQVPRSKDKRQHRKRYFKATWH